MSDIQTIPSTTTATTTTITSTTTLSLESTTEATTIISNSSESINPQSLETSLVLDPLRQVDAHFVRWLCSEPGVKEVLVHEVGKFSHDDEVSSRSSTSTIKVDMERAVEILESKVRDLKGVEGGLDQTASDAAVDIAMSTTAESKSTNETHSDLLSKMNNMSFEEGISNSKMISINNNHTTTDMQDNINMESMIPKAKKDSGVDLLTMEGHIPRFYFPKGKPKTDNQKSLATILDDVKILFGLDSSSSSDGSAVAGYPITKMDLWPIMDCCGLPRYASFALFEKIKAQAVHFERQGTNGYEEEEKEEEKEDVESKAISFDDFSRWFSSVYDPDQDEFGFFFKLLKSSTTQSVLVSSDFLPLIEEVVQRHPGLEFLSSMPIFQARYVDTVITRIFYSKKGNGSDHITLADFRRHSFLEMFRRLQDEDDINMARDIFSYKHFYVIYCKFWELDIDHDMVIEGDALYRYDRHALLPIVVDRVLSGACRKLGVGGLAHAGAGTGTGTGGVSGAKGERKMTYRDFIWFMLSAEDKKSASGIEYWFRCLDLDGDGRISLYEMEAFYKEQYKRMMTYRMSDPWKFSDFVCSLFDLVKPANPAWITLGDLKKCSNTPLFFDMIFDLKKYDMHIRRIDPTFRELDDVWIEDGDKRFKLEGWDKYAERAYDQLAQEESSGQQRNNTTINTISTTSYRGISYLIDEGGNRDGEEDGEGGGISFGVEDMEDGWEDQEDDENDNVGEVTGMTKVGIDRCVDEDEEDYEDEDGEGSNVNHWTLGDSLSSSSSLSVDGAIVDDGEAEEAIFGVSHALGSSGRRKGRGDRGNNSFGVDGKGVGVAGYSVSSSSIYDVIGVGVEPIEWEEEEEGRLDLDIEEEDVVVEEEEEDDGDGVALVAEEVKTGTTRTRHLGETTVSVDNDTLTSAIKVHISEDCGYIRSSHGKDGVVANYGGDGDLSMVSEMVSDVSDDDS